MSRLRSRLSRFLVAAPAALLTAEFAIFDGAFYVGRPFGNDARLYLMATRAWLAGDDPWIVESAGTTFAGPPVTLLPFAPFAWLDPETMIALITVASVGSAFFIVRHLGLAPWWLLFPPLIEAVWSGSVTVIVVALALTRLQWLAVVTKTYAGLPALVLGQTRQLLAAALVVVVTLPFLPWQAFFSHDLATTLNEQAWGGRSAWIAPAVLVPIALLGLALVGRRRAAWYAVPVLWPATQLHYSTFAMAARPSSVAAAILALPWPGAPVAAVIADAIVTRAPAWLAARRAAGERAAAGSSAAQEGDSVPAQVLG